MIAVAALMLILPSHGPSEARWFCAIEKGPREVVVRRVELTSAGGLAITLLAEMRVPGERIGLADISPDGAFVALGTIPEPASHNVDILLLSLSRDSQVRKISVRDVQAHSWFAFLPDGHLSYLEGVNGKIRQVDVDPRTMKGSARGIHERFPNYPFDDAKRHELASGAADQLRSLKIPPPLMTEQADPSAKASWFFPWKQSGVADVNWDGSRIAVLGYDRRTKVHHVLVLGESTGWKPRAISEFLKGSNVWLIRFWSEYVVIGIEKDGIRKVCLFDADSLQMKHQVDCGFFLAPSNGDGQKRSEVGSTGATTLVWDGEECLGEACLGDPKPPKEPYHWG